MEFLLSPRERPREFFVEVLDQGVGFDPEEVANPLDAENMLKSSGRGIFFMKSFMDDVRMARRPEGGMSVRMSKKLRLSPSGTCSTPFTFPPPLKRRSQQGACIGTTSGGRWMFAKRAPSTW